MHYRIRCLDTNQILEEDGFILNNPDGKNSSLIRAEYKNKQIMIHDEKPGIFRYADWLPVNRILPSPGFPITYKSKHLANMLQLDRLYITFSGYWPERGAFLTTGTFKECEAYAVCARYPKESRKVLVVASAGNTARAFLKVASENRIPLVVVVPQICLSELWQEKPLQPWTRVISLAGNSDYFDAIQLAEKISQFEGYQAEGGAKNIARRDGMGTTVLSASATIGEIPDYYFQAVGSGTGAIAAHESNLRLIEDGRFGNKLMSLQLSQNNPFLPIYHAWSQRRRDIDLLDAEESRRLCKQIMAKVLSNRNPPYSLVGGLYDALTATEGSVYPIDNEAIIEAQILFQEQEGCDVCPEAGVAIASMIEALSTRQINRESIIMLNITGGGFERIRKELKPQFIEPDVIINPDISNEKLESQLGKIKDNILISLDRNGRNID